ncbi:MAG TPA: thiopurine S-methyltransferase [Gammaproteobacteria bacterium]|nr:thiopurine S-methyltransferase [Gammaproteobacteria bacterium]
MKADFWHARWEAGEIGWHRDEVNTHLEVQWPRLGAPAGTPVFVPLCGKSVDLCWLRSAGHPVVGVEVSPRAVADFYREQGLEPQVENRDGLERWEADGVVIWCADFFDLTPAHLGAVGAVYDRASLVALPPVMRERYAAHMKALLPPAARILLLTLDYPQGQMDGPPFSVSGEEVTRLYGDAYAVETLYEEDALPDHPGLRGRGVRRLSERVYRLAPR